ncbi:MAG: VOC family protein [Streptococcaceae bacterium]|jgi:lactoylglutathione lyase|nr:VOC family protein [Streptococcaceae bacterium]
MKIEHIGLMCRDLERMRAFYERWFGATAGAKYENQKTTFQSYFLTFESGSRLEIGTRSDLADVKSELGYAHLALSLGSKAEVDRLAAALGAVSGPRTTGDGYYEAVVLDPEGNQIELTL